MARSSRLNVQVSQRCRMTSGAPLSITMWRPRGSARSDTTVAANLVALEKGTSKILGNWARAEATAKNSSA
jgi:hypothetical protein